MQYGLKISPVLFSSRRGFSGATKYTDLCRRNRQFADFGKVSLRRMSALAGRDKDFIFRQVGCGVKRLF